MEKLGVLFLLLSGCSTSTIVGRGSTISGMWAAEMDAQAQGEIICIRDKKRLLDLLIKHRDTTNYTVEAEALCE